MWTLPFTTPSTARTLSRVLWFDAAVCLAMGAGLIALAGPLGEATDLPASLLTVAGLLLPPVAALIGYAAMRPSLRLVRLVVAGNLAWVAASLALVLFGLAPMNGLGAALEGLGAAAAGETA